MNAKIFGSFIAECRKEKNMTQADLAVKLNVTDKAVSRWERGIGFPDINTIELLASALEISVSELMKSERTVTGEAAKKETTDVISDTLNVIKLQRISGLTRILIILFAGTNILYAIGGGDRILQTICMIGILIIAAIMSVVTVKNKENNKAKQTIVQMLYCGSTVWFAFGLSQFAGNIISGILIIAITVCYIRFLQ